MPATQLSSSRLILRSRQDTDLPAFADINADPAVMELFPALLPKNQSDALSHKLARELEERSWGYWAVECVNDKAFIGFVGISPTHNAPGGEQIEIAWRLGRFSWGQGYATEAALAVLKYAFTTLNLSNVIALTALRNMRSRRVMERIGMCNTGENFAHPGLPADSSLSIHVLYKLSRTAYLESAD